MPTLKDYYDGLEEENARLKARIATLEAENARLRARCAEPVASASPVQKPAPAPSVSRQVSWPSYSTAATKTPPARASAPSRELPRTTCQPKSQSSYSTEQVAQITRAYNSLPHGGMNDRLARRAFIERYAIEGFSCINAAERVNNARLAPEFRTEQPLRADYWAVPMRGGIYFVMPNQRQGYDENVHFAGAMGEVFESNFATGTLYQHVKVVKPACFRKVGERWELAQIRGKLTLS